MPANPRTKAANPIFGCFARVGVFALIGLLGVSIIPSLLMPVAELFVTAALGTFAAAAIANAISVRIFERGRLADIGLGWSRACRRNLTLGILGGISAALVVTVLPILVGQAHFERLGSGHVQWRSVMFVSIVLLFGAAGEEMLFRGYAFQVLVRTIGPFATVLPMGVLFGLAHLSNQNVNWLGLGNTMIWGILFGTAFLRSGDLWLPVGLHFGWNWVLPLMGVNLSGFTMEWVVGYSLHSSLSLLWNGGAYGPEGGLLTTLVLVGLFYYLWKAPIERQHALLLRGPKESPDAS